MATRRSARQSAIQALLCTSAGESLDALDGELSELSDSDVEMGARSQREFCGNAAEQEGEEDGFSENERPAKRRKTAEGKTVLENNRKKSITATKKTSTAPKPKRAGRSRVQSRLKNVMTLPLDVLFEIFSALQPSDLLALARTSKPLRQVMMNRSNIGIWKAARNNVSGPATPEPPVGISEPAWAQLLYGDSGCYSCRAAKAQTVRVDFGLRRRACTGCKQQYLVWSSRFSTLCHGMDPTLMDLVGYTNVGGYSHGRASNSRFYWKRDLQSMEQCVAKLRDGPGGLDAVREFRAKRIVLVDQWMQGVDALDAWAARSEREATDVRISNEDSIYNIIVERLVATGYDKRDIPSQRDIRSSVSRKQELTNASWKRMRPALESKTVKARDQRLEKEKTARLESRIHTAAWLYRDFLHTLVPVQWRFLPTPQHLLDSKCHGLPCLSTLINAEGDPTPEQWSEAIAQLPVQLSTHLASHLVPLKEAIPDLSGVPEFFELVPLSSESDPFVLDSITSRFASLDLARAVFMLDDHDWTTGCESLHRWDVLSTSTGVKAPVFSLKGSAAVRGISDAEGKMFTTVTATELDVSCSAAWYRCTCTDKPGKACVGFQGWRAFVDHCIQQTDDDTHQPIVIPASAAPPTPKRGNVAKYRQWACAHCAKYCMQFKFGDHRWCEMSMETFAKFHGKMAFALGDQSEVIEHIRTVHDVQNPIEHVDCFYFATPGTTRPVVSTPVARRKVGAQTASVTAINIASSSHQAGGFRCLRCPGLGRNRVFVTVDAVHSHLMAKHQSATGAKVAADLVQGVDFAALSSSNCV